MTEDTHAIHQLIATTQGINLQHDSDGTPCSWMCTQYKMPSTSARSIDLGIRPVQRDTRNPAHQAQDTNCRSLNRIQCKHASASSMDDSAKESDGIDDIPGVSSHMHCRRA